MSDPKRAPRPVDEMTAATHNKAHGARNMMRLIAAALRLVWKAGRREFIVVMAMDLLQAVGVFVVIVQIQGLLSELITHGGKGDVGDLSVNLVLFLFANTAIVLAEAVISNRRIVLGELVSIYVCSEVLEVACLAELDDFDNHRFHDRLQRAASSATTRPTRLVQSIVTIGQNLLGLVAVWGALLFVQPWIALCAALVVVPVWIGGTRGGAQFFDFVARMTPSDRDRTYLFGLLTMRDPAKEIRAFNLAAYLSNRWRTSMTDRLAVLRQTLGKRLRSSMLSSIGSNVVLALAAVLLIGLNRWGVMTLAQSATAAGVLLLFSQRLIMLVGATNDFFESAPLVGDLDEFIALGPSLRRERSGRPHPGRFSEIVLDDVGFTYRGAQRPAIDGVSLTIKAGEVVALVGENGSGKTTLAKLLAGLYTPTSGAILVDQANLRETDAASWREAVGVLFQDFIRYGLPAEENIYLGAVSRDRDPAAIREAAVVARADQFLNGLPRGYDTILSPQFNEGQDLSLGQWQRIALARVVFRGAPLVILDEPTASMDARAEQALFESVHELYQNRTVVLISHRFSTVRTADRIVVLSGGKVVEQGGHDELMAANGLYAELFTLQASGFVDVGILGG
jgi:ATP-binding cassette subfamily B protein